MDLFLKWNRISIDAIMDHVAHIVQVGARQMQERILRLVLALTITLGALVRVDI